MPRRHLEWTPAPDDEKRLERVRILAKLRSSDADLGRASRLLTEYELLRDRFEGFLEVTAEEYVAIGLEEDAGGRVDTREAIGDIGEATELLRMRERERERRKLGRRRENEWRPWDEW